MLRTYFQNNGIKYSRWAVANGINPSILCRFLKGEIIPNTRTLIKIAAASGLSLEEILKTNNSAEDNQVRRTG